MRFQYQKAFCEILVEFKTDGKLIKNKNISTGTFEIQKGWLSLCNVYGMKYNNYYSFKFNKISKIIQSTNIQNVSENC